MEKESNRTMMRGEAFLFGPYRFATSPFVLCQDGVEVSLQGQPGLCLELFVRRAGEIVHRDEIREALWGDDRHVEWEQGINHVVRKIRKLLRDDARQPRYLETIPRVGYRFVAPVTVETAPTPRAQDDRSVAAEPKGAGRLGLRAALWLLAPLLLATWFWASADGADEPGGARPQIELGAVPEPARRAYLEGRHYLSRSEMPSIQRRGELPSMHRAAESFQRAIDEAPSFGPAYSGLSQALFRADDATPAPDPAMSLQARRAAERAIELIGDPSAHAVVGLLDARDARDWGGAFDHLYRAIERDPDQSDAHEGLAAVLAVQRRDREARRLLERSLARHEDKYPSLLTILAYVEYRAGHTKKALELVDHLLDVAPMDVNGWWLGMRIHLDLGDTERAFAMANGLLTRYGGQPVASFEEFWRRRDAQLIPFHDAGRRMDAQLGYSAWYRGEKEEAVSLFTSACKRGGSWAALFVAGDPVLEKLRDTYGFDQLSACLRRNHGPFVAELGSGAPRSARPDVLALPALSFAQEPEGGPIPVASLGSLPFWRDAPEN